MKKVFTGLMLLIFSISLFAKSRLSEDLSYNRKDGTDMKNFRFGGTILPSLFWYKPDNLKKFSANGAVAKFGVIINGEYSFSGNFAFGFGLGLASSGGKMTFSDTARYYFNDDAIISLVDTAGLNKKYDHYKLNNRTYNASYYIIPLSLKMRTNEIGYMRYFFQPSLNIGFRNKVRAKDDLTTLPKTGPLTGAGQSANQNNLDITADMNFLRISATLSGGGEYYVSGSTAIVFAIGFDYGLSNVVQKNSEYLLRTDSKAVEQKFSQNGVILSVGILF